MLLRKDPSTLHLWNGFVSFVSFRCVADITCSHTDRISQFRCAEKMPLLHHPINLSASSVRPTYSALLKYNLVSGKTAHLIRWWDRTSSTAKINHFELPFNTSPSKHCFFLVNTFRVEHKAVCTNYGSLRPHCNELLYRLATATMLPTGTGIVYTVRFTEVPIGCSENISLLLRCQ